MKKRVSKHQNSQTVTEPVINGFHQVSTVPSNLKWYKALCKHTTIHLCYAFRGRKSSEWQCNRIANLTITSPPKTFSEGGKRQ
jgi:hypothetical protein